MQIINSTELIIKSIIETGILKAYIENKTELHIYADKIEILSDFIDISKDFNKLDYNLVIYMMHCLSKQQLFLEKIGYSFYSFCLKDIVVIDDNYFFCINPELIMPINKNKNQNIITFYKPPIKSKFSSPELLAITNIPFKLSYKTIYYSFGALAIYCLGKSSSYKYTKLYWFIKRCIGIGEKNKELENKELKNKEIEERQLLFI